MNLPDWKGKSIKESEPQFVVELGRFVNVDAWWEELDVERGGHFWRSVKTRWGIEKAEGEKVLSWIMGPMQEV